jgi:hypothetical protein
MFNDRRMAVREEQKNADSAVRLPFLVTPFKKKKKKGIPLTFPTGPANQLQDQHEPRQRLQVRDRGRPVGADKTVRAGHLLHGDADARDGAVRDVRVQGAAARGGAREGARGEGQAGRREERQLVGGGRGCDSGGELIRTLYFVVAIIRHGVVSFPSASGRWEAVGYPALDTIDLTDLHGIYSFVTATSLEGYI